MIKVVRGNPTPEELAAALAVVRDVEEITERPVDLHEFALGPAERRLLASACAE
ncbi:acyl-CoA carboxylase subunit epsilon, partial [Streptomyces klenkii]|uniref:acyl-CoA carboxylase subunit epsilon n=1 Tax=Streptomyces klenkii TaxID=1420899 RepID=UPI003F4D5D2C